MRIEDIIYQTTRELINTEDKLRIATLFLFCQRLSCKSLAELMYTHDVPAFITSLNKEYEQWEVDFNINLEDRNIKSAFHKTRQQVIAKWDDSGYYKAIYEGDPFALVIADITRIDFSITKKPFTKQIGQQLSLWE